MPDRTDSWRCTPTLLSDHLQDRPDRFLRALEAQVEGHLARLIRVLELTSALERCG